jgi:hypothetical protein
MGVCDLEKAPVTIGVGALEFLPLSGSPYMLSRNEVAYKSWPSEESDDCNEFSRPESEDCAGMRILVPIDRNRTSSVICVRPRCDRDPRIVWLYLSQRSEFTRFCRFTFPLPVTPRVATSPSLPVLKMFFTNCTVPVDSKMSSCVASSRNTCVNPNFSTALFRESFGGCNVTCVGDEVWRPSHVDVGGSTINQGSSSSAFSV